MACLRSTNPVYKQLLSVDLPVRFQLPQKMKNTLVKYDIDKFYFADIVILQLILLILGALLVNAAPRPSTPIGNSELEVITTIDKREAHIITTIDKREADPIPPIGTCGC